MGIKMLKVSAFYFMIGVFMGMYMSMANDHSITPAHVHLLLLGWVSFAIAGLIYHFFPTAANSKLGKTHYWLHFFGVPLMSIGLIGAIKGFMPLFVAVLIGSVLITVGVVVFFINVLRNVKIVTEEA